MDILDGFQGIIGMTREAFHNESEWGDILKMRI